MVLPRCQVSHFFHTSSQAVSYCQNGKSVPCLCFLRSTVSAVRGILSSFVMFYRKVGSKDKSALPLGLYSSNAPVWCYSNLSLGMLQRNWNESEASILTRQQWPNRHIPHLSGKEAVYTSGWDKDLETPLGKAACPLKKSHHTPTPSRALRTHSPRCLTAFSPNQSGAFHYLQLLHC